MKKIYLLALIAFTKGYTQCQNEVTWQSGTQMVNNIAVTITSSGFVVPETECEYGPYNVGRNPNGVSGNGSYTFNFSPAISAVSLDITALNHDTDLNKEEIEILINNQHYTPVVGNQGTQCGFYIPTLPILNAAGYLCDPSDNQSNTSACNNLYIEGNISSFKIVCHSTGVGLMGGTPFALKICGALGLSAFDKVTTTISPNPFSAQADIYLSRPIANGSVQLMNGVGQIVKEIKGVAGNQITINRDGLANGIYFIRLFEENRVVYVGKVVVQ